MRLDFRSYHTSNFLQGWRAPQQKESPLQPIDKALYLYFKKHRALGSKDREVISEKVYRLVRWRLKIEALLLQQLQRTLTWEDYFCEIPQIERFYETLLCSENLSFPEELFQLLVESLGAEEACRTAAASNQPAPLFLRVNRLKTRREKLMQELPESWSAQPGPLEDSIFLPKRVALFQSPSFLRGEFEVQDLSSQRLVQLVQARPGDHVLDYCAGSGGKTLGFASYMQGKGQIYLYDIRPWALEEAKKRLKRAGIENFQLLNETAKKGSMDWVLVDAPCSGSGTLRRHPDKKEAIDRDYVASCVALQREIFGKACAFVKKSGYIVYGTCSVLSAENQEQIDYFLAHYRLKKTGEALRTFPEAKGGDGFFGMVLQKQS